MCIKTAYRKKIVSNIPVLASVCFIRPIYHFTIFRFARIVRKIYGNGVPKMLYYREYFQYPSPDEGKWMRFYFEMVFRWNIIPKYFAS